MVAFAVRGIASLHEYRVLGLSGPSHGYRALTSYVGHKIVVRAVSLALIAVLREIAPRATANGFEI
jgi:hypothetical protein